MYAGIYNIHVHTHSHTCFWLAIFIFSTAILIFSSFTFKAFSSSVREASNCKSVTNLSSRCLMSLLEICTKGEGWGQVSMECWDGTGWEQYSGTIVDSIGTQLAVLYREVPNSEVDLYTALCGRDCSVLIRKVSFIQGVLYRELPM